MLIRNDPSSGCNNTRDEGGCIDRMWCEPLGKLRLTTSREAEPGTVLRTRVRPPDQSLWEGLILLLWRKPRWLGDGGTNEILGKD